MLNVKAYARAADFLGDVQAYLEQRETANSLILGLAMRLVDAPQSYGDDAPYFAAVFDGDKPILAALLTPPHAVLLASELSDPTAALALLARDLAESGPRVTGVLGPPRPAELFAEIWSRLTGVASRHGIRERLYALREVIPPRETPGFMRVAVESDAAQIYEWSDAFHHEATPGHPASPSQATLDRIIAGKFFLWDDDGPVSMAMRNRTTRRTVSIGPVYTPPERRGRGYATACTAALSRLLLDEGFESCVLFTDLANPTSNAIYQQIGYRPVCDFQEILFT